MAGAARETHIVTSLAERLKKLIRFAAGVKWVRLRAVTFGDKGFSFRMDIRLWRVVF